MSSDFDESLKDETCLVEQNLGNIYLCAILIVSVKCSHEDTLKAFDDFKISKKVHEMFFDM